MRVISVELAKAQRKAVPIDVDSIGTVTPISSVALKSRLETTIFQVHFEDGAKVNEGDVLFTLDARQIGPTHRGDRRGRVRQTFAVFARETEARLALFQEFGEGNDREQIKIKAHAIKGAARSLGAGDMSDIARLIEIRAAKISADELRDEVFQFDAVYRKMRLEFEGDITQVA